MCAGHVALYDEACAINTVPSFCLCLMLSPLFVGRFQNSLKQASENLKVCRLVVFLILPLSFVCCSALLVTTDHVGTNHGGASREESNRELIVSVLADAHVG